MRKMSLSLVLVGVLAPLAACGGGQTRAEVAHERASQVTEDRYAEVRAREEAVAAAHQDAIAAEQTQAIIREYSPEALQSACEILAATPATPEAVEEESEATAEAE